MWGYLNSVWRRIVKWVKHLFTSKSEIYCVCQGKWHTGKMSFDVLLSLYRSRELKEQIFSLLFDENMNVPHITNLICSVKKIPQNQTLVLINLSHSLQAIKAVNALLGKITECKQDVYDSNRVDHRNKLNRLWDLMKPGVRRSGDSMITSEWGEIGFQGRDPSTDFRGMGMFALIQLLYFAEKYPEKSRAILLSSNHPRRFYPYAATAINMTGFVYELLRERRLYKFLLVSLEENQSSIYSTFHDGPSENNQLMVSLLTAVNDLFCKIYYDFYELWESRDPPNVMSFQNIFGELKDRYYKQYPRLHEY